VIKKLNYAQYIKNLATFYDLLRILWRVFLFCFLRPQHNITTQHDYFDRVRGKDWQLKISATLAVQKRANDEFFFHPVHQRCRCSGILWQW